MADYNWDMKSGVGGYMGEVNKPVFNGFEERNDDQRRRETLQDAPERLTDNRDADRGVGGEQLHTRSYDYGASGEGAGAHDRPSYVQSQFGLEGTTGTNRTQGPDSHLGETNTSSKHAIEPRASASDQTTAPGEDGWRPEDLTRTQGPKKHEMLNRIKEKMPGHHNAAAGDPKGAPKKGVMEKIKEKLPGHHGNDAGM